MSEMETVIRHPVFQLVFGCALGLLQFYVTFVVKSIKKEIEQNRKDAKEDSESQWDHLNHVEEKLNVLQGEHNARKDRCK